MNNIGKISSIPKQYPNNGVDTMQTSLAKKGLTRAPGTGVYKFPFKELDGKYRTGLDPSASYIGRILDPSARKLEIERVTALKNKLEEALGLDLSPRSSYWNYGLSKDTGDSQHVQAIKLMDGDNFFDLKIPHQELIFSWLRVHPTIASSLNAYRNREYPSDTQFYVADDEMENEILFLKKDKVNKAIVSLSNMTPEKKKKVARLLGLPVTDSTKESTVYNLIDTLLKKEEFESGAHKGLSTIQIFNGIIQMNDGVLEVKDLIKQAIDHQVYRKKPNGVIVEGDYTVADSEDQLAEQLLDETRQEDILMLKEKLRGKKLNTI